MGKMKEDSKSNSSREFNLKVELSDLVAKNIIPSRVADKIEQKLTQNNINITKDQLHNLAYKIRDAINNYVKTNQKTDLNPRREEWEQPGTDMKKLVDVIERLEERVSTIEEAKNIHTTDENKISISTNTDWDISPLQDIPSDPESIIILMKWLQQLIDKCGRDNLSNILDYYVDIGWLSQNAKISLIDYSHGITEEKNGENAKRDVSHLPSKDHIQSLIYIEKLKGRQLDKHFVDRIDGDLDRIMKKLNNYQFK